MEAVNASQLVFRIGVPFENAWLPRMTQLAPAAKVIDLRDGLILRQVDLPPRRDATCRRRARSAHLAGTATGHAHGRPYPR